MSRSVNFAEIKQRISIIQGAKLLGLSLAEDGNSLRCACSACEGDDRSLSLLEEANTFKCFASNEYGSVIDLVAHVKGIGLREAGQWLVEQEENPEPEPKPEPVVLTPLEKLPKLDASSGEVSESGLDPDIAQVVGVGFATVGVLKGCIGVPLYIDGDIVGYIGVPKGTALKLPKNLRAVS